MPASDHGYMRSDSFVCMVRTIFSAASWGVSIGLFNLLSMWKCLCKISNHPKRCCQCLNAMIGKIARPIKQLIQWEFRFLQWWLLRQNWDSWSINESHNIFCYCANLPSIVSDMCLKLTLAPHYTTRLKTSLRPVCEAIVLNNRWISGAILTRSVPKAFHWTRIARGLNLPLWHEQTTKQTKLDVYKQ